ncbi:hypothetical protein NLG97_g1119 [Lecanicillium saksenae]|uniref:Uncharacterized protein n=1 Tax=Lecanicillium saksenae TaxID=468837 RepID=A0ACC1R4M9_9HYPO|nr:hypothetical protein NLG97_g1119 [Lecanicillium saksenae]
MLRAVVTNRWSAPSLQSLDDIPLHRKTVIVIGASSGLGLEAARHFVRLGAAHVVLGVRSEARGQAAKRNILESVNGNVAQACKIEVRLIDLASFASVRQFAQGVTKDLDRIDIAVLNAGISKTELNITQDGWEENNQVNALAPTLLSLLLLPKMRESAAADWKPRLSIVGSRAYQSVPNNAAWLDADKILENLNKDQELAGFGGRYAVSKLLVMFAMREIAQVATSPDGSPSVVVNLLNPGACVSDLTRDVQGWPQKAALAAFQYTLCKTTEEGSRTLVFGSAYGEKSHGKWIQNNHVEDGPRAVWNPGAGLGAEFSTCLIQLSVHGQRQAFYLATSLCPLHLESQLCHDLGAMVGVKSSKGCATCLRRSIKCDEQRPSCSQCRRGGRACPGYERVMAFIDEGVKLRERNPTQRRSGSRRRPSPRVKDEQSPESQFDLAHRRPCISSQASTPEKELRAPLNVPSPRAEQGQIVASFVSAMFPLGIASLQMSLLGTWLWHIPPRLGRNAALDHASLAVAMAYFGRTTRNDAVVAGAERAYAMALQTLSVMLGTKDMQFEPEVLCATMLLGQYESFSGTGYAWIRHAGGAGRLMRLRGARRSYESAFEYSMFLACRGTIISQALASETPCFLDEKSWQSIPDGLIEFPLLPSDAHLYHSIFCQYAAIPGTVCQELERWYNTYISFQGGRKTPALLNKKSDSADESPFTDAYVYYDTISASNITACYAYQILLQREVDALLPGTYARENLELAQSICKSVDYLSNAGYCGTQTMRLTLPIAQSVLPAKYQPWITSKIAQLSQGLNETTLLSSFQ